MNSVRQYGLAVLCCGMFFLFSSISASAADLKGSADSSLLPRYEGSFIVQYSMKAYDSMLIPLGKAVYGKDSYAFPEAMKVEGKVTRILYIIPPERSALEVFRNYEGVLKEKGYVSVYGCSDKECGPYDSLAQTLYGRDNKYPIPGDERTKNQQFLAARLDRPQGAVYVTLYVFENTFWGTETSMLKNRTYCRVDITETKPMEERMVVVKADEMAREIDLAGKIALYGIYFDTDKTEIKKDSVPTLEEIASLLKDRPKLKVLVVGHTDSMGEREYNMGLSRRRAEAVVKYLVSTFKIAQSRLVPAGVGMLAPVATNRTEEGRSKNRRVELVEF